MVGGCGVRVRVRLRLRLVCVWLVGGCGRLRVSVSLNLVCVWSFCLSPSLSEAEAESGPAAGVGVCCARLG